MVIKQYPIYYDLITGIVLPYKVSITQGDTDSIQFVVTITNNGASVDLSNISSTFTFQKEDGNIVVGQAEVNKENIVYTVGTQEIAYPGKVIATFELYGQNGERLSSSQFKFTVIEELGDDSPIESTTEYTILAQLMKDNMAIQSAEETRIKNENERITAEQERRTEYETLKDEMNSYIADIQDAVESSQTALDLANQTSQIINDTVENATEIINQMEEIIGDATDSIDTINTLTQTVQQNESERVTAEQERIDNEEERIQNESDRVSAEQTREANENERITQEDIRVTNENSRITAENNRIAKETERQEDEAERVTKEAERINAENTRISNENDRISSEQDRVSAENTRIQNEAERINAEAIREENETARINAEITREENEAEREQLKTALETLKDSLESGNFGDMYKSVYDINNNGIVDNTEKLENKTLFEIKQEIDTPEYVNIQTNSDIVSVPDTAKGQISGVELKGLTASNLIKNGNFRDGISQWNSTDATMSVSDNTLIVKGNGNSNIPRVYQVVNLYKGRKYYVSAKVKVTNSVCKNIFVYFGGGGDVNLPELKNPVENQIYNISGTLEIEKGATEIPVGLFVRHTYEDAETANGSTMEVRDVIVIDLTAHGLEGKTEEELDAMFPHYFDGTKSTVGAVRIKSVGKNIFDGEMINAFIDTETGQLVSSETDVCSKNFIPIIPGETYIFSQHSKGKHANYFIYDAKRNYVRYIYASAGTSVTFADNEYYIKIGYSSGYQDVEELQVEKGSVVTSYEPYQESNIYVLAKDLETGEILKLRSLPNGVRDRIYRKDNGEWEAELNTKEVTLNGVNSDGDNYERLAFNFSQDNSFCRLDFIDWGNLNNYALGTDYILKNDIHIFEKASINLSTGDSFRTNIDSFALFITLPTSYLEENYEATKSGFIQYLQEHPVTLIYQLAEPEIYPVEVSGNLEVYKNGTIYFEPSLWGYFTFNENETSKEITTEDLPLKSIRKVIKYEFIEDIIVQTDVTNECTHDNTSITINNISYNATYFYDCEIFDEYSIPAKKQIILSTNLAGNVESIKNDKYSNDEKKVKAILVNQNNKLLELSNKVLYKKTGITWNDLMGI